MFILKNDKELGCSVSKLLCGWLCGLRLYPLFISSGILTRGGFGQEMKTRIYERFNPSFKDINDFETEQPNSLSFFKINLKKMQGWRNFFL